MIINRASQIRQSDLFFQCENFIESANTYLKIEGLNIAGSIKLKTATQLIKCIETLYGVNPIKNKIIESSSGNLGVALSIICKEKGYQFTCVTDPNISPEAEKYIKLYGAELIKVTERDSSGGYLETRINLINKIIKEDPSYIWTNQYANPDNPNAHYYETASEILREIPTVDYLFVGAGTTGTLIGCATYFREHSPKTTIVAIDTVGSVTFDRPPSKRYIPGIGTSRKPELIRNAAVEKLIDDLVMVDEKDGVRMCHHLLNKYCLFVGGSTGSVMHAVKNYSNYKTSNPTIVAISPDLGNKYINTVFNLEWANTTFSLLPEDLQS